jgi:hypothetical protein
MCNHTEGKFHDCSYVDARNRQIPAAERYANEICSATARQQHGAVWCAAFLLRMDDLSGTKRPRLS